ncbi:hypothetical protein D3C85_979300 [compost metagenome]
MVISELQNTFQKRLIPGVKCMFIHHRVMIIRPKNILFYIYCMEEVKTKPDGQRKVKQI